MTPTHVLPLNRDTPHKGIYYCGKEANYEDPKEYYTFITFINYLTLKKDLICQECLNSPDLNLALLAKYGA